MANTIQTTSRRHFLCGLGAVVGLMALPCVNASAAMPATMPMTIEDTKLFTRSVIQAHMGTFVHITARNASQSLLDDALERAFTMAVLGEKIFTRHGSNSLGEALVELNERKSIENAPHELIDIIEQSKTLSIATKSFNPAISPVLATLVEYKVSTFGQLPRSVQKDLSVIANPQNIALSGKSIKLLHNDMSLTLDGIAKGRVVDMMALSLEKSGITDYCINAGGDIRVSGPKEWNIGIQDATAPAQHNGVVRLQNGAVASSGNYESLAVKGYEHLISTKPHHSVSHETILSTTVIAPNCAQADAMATAMFVMAQEHGASKAFVFLDSYKECACQFQTAAGVFNSKTWPV